MMVEADAELHQRCKISLNERVWNVAALQCMVNRNNIQDVMKLCPMSDPDLFIIDIDGVDYFVTEAVLALGFRPKIVAVEYNSAFGPDNRITVGYKTPFDRWREHPSGLYYGASLGAWQALLGRYRYKFVTVESSGTNAFFVNPDCFSDTFVCQLKGIAFLNNNSDLNEATRPIMCNGVLTGRKREWQQQWKLISQLDYLVVSP